MPRPTKVLIDMDPGTDDALALMMALVSLDLEVVAVTTVGGNATVAHTTRNALRLLDHLGVTDVPVYRGAARPYRGAYRYAYGFHGAAGLGVRLPAPMSRPHLTPAAAAIISAADRPRGSLTLIALGPLTNVARAYDIAPRLPEWLGQLVVMGGAVDVPGNMTPHAEFNINNDPIAANIVLGMGAPTVLVGLDVCRPTSLTSVDMPWPAGDSPTARLARRVLEGWFRTHADLPQYDLCDPLAVALALRPGLAGYRCGRVTVEVEDAARLGKTSAVYGRGTVAVATEVDAPAAKALMQTVLQQP